MTLATADSDDDRSIALVAEDDAFSNAMITDFVERLGYSVMSASSGGSAIALLDSCDPDVAIIDLDLGDGPNGVDVGNAVVERSPWAAIVLLSSHSSVGMVSRTTANPTWPFFQHVVKSSVSSPADISDSIDRAIAGQPQAALDAGIQLTLGQAELLRFVARGMSNEEIARRRGVQSGSIERMLTRLYRTLDLPNDPSRNLRVEAARKYLAGGIVSS